MTVAATFLVARPAAYASDVMVSAVTTAATTTAPVVPPALPVALSSPPPPPPTVVMGAVSITPMISRRDELRLMGRLWYAALLGAAVGKERSTASHHPAGVRTLALVSLGSAAFTLCSMYGFGAAGKFDTSRMASAVASGIGFIGAGVITTTTRRNESIVHGLTTAAAVWISAAVGVTCGTGLYILATSLAAATLGFLRIGGNVKHNKKSHERKAAGLVPGMEGPDPELLRRSIDWEKVKIPGLAHAINEIPRITMDPYRIREDKDDESLISKRYFPENDHPTKASLEEDERARKEEEDEDDDDDDYFYDDDDDELVVIGSSTRYSNETEGFRSDDEMRRSSRSSSGSHHRYDDDVGP